MTNLASQFSNYLRKTSGGRRTYAPRRCTRTSSQEQFKNIVDDDPNLVFCALNRSSLPAVSANPQPQHTRSELSLGQQAHLAPGEDQGTQLALPKPANYRVDLRSLPYQPLPLTVVDSAETPSYRLWESPAGEILIRPIVCKYTDGPAFPFLSDKPK